MGYVIDTTSSDVYQELLCPHSKRVTAQVTGASIFIGFGTALGQPRAWTAIYDSDEVLLPCLAGLDRDCDAVRFKSYQPGTPAAVKLSAG